MDNTGSSSIKFIENESRVMYVKFNPPFSTICSIGEAPFWGKVLIEYEPTDYLLEFESVEKYLKTLSLAHTTIEEITRVIFDEIAQVLGDIPLRITVTARTTVHAPAGAKISQGVFRNG